MVERVDRWCSHWHPPSCCTSRKSGRAFIARLITSSGAFDSGDLNQAMISSRVGGCAVAGAFCLRLGFFHLVIPYAARFHSCANIVIPLCRL